MKATQRKSVCVTASERYEGMYFRKTEPENKATRSDIGWTSEKKLSKHYGHPPPKQRSLICTKCGKEAVDPHCIENCPKHLCEECGEKCFQSDSEDTVDCECPYEPDDDDGYYEEEEIDPAELDEERSAWEDDPEVW